MNFGEINHNKTDTIRDLGKVDVSVFQNCLAELGEELWEGPEAHYNPNKRGMLQQVEHITFRFSNKRKSPVQYREFPIWVKWKKQLLPVMNMVTNQYNYEQGFYPRVMLAKLPSKAIIPSHVDGDASKNQPHKIHIPIISNPNAYFILGGEQHHLEVGRAYEVNNAMAHEVENLGATDRVHLIFEYLNASIQPHQINLAWILESKM